MASREMRLSSAAWISIVRGCAGSAALYVRLDSKSSRVKGERTRSLLEEVKRCRQCQLLGGGEGK